MKKSYKKGDSDSILAPNLAGGIAIFASEQSVLRSRCTATKGCDGLLPLPCDPGKHRHVESRYAAAVNDQWDRLLPIFTRWLPAPRVLHPNPRHSSKVGAVCVEALVRICAGGDQ